MTSTTARTTANVLLVAAGVAAAYVVVTTPPLRRLASARRPALAGASVPSYLLDQGGGLGGVGAGRPDIIDAW